MDPYKLLREASAIELFSQFDWKSALDFGCGSGRYFPLFRRLSMTREFPRSLLGVDADRARLEEAQSMLNKLGTDERLVVELKLRDESVFRSDLVDVKFDLILCSHVLEHVTEHSFREILFGLSSCVASGGRVIVLVQGFWNDRIEGRDLSEAEQYLHLVDTTEIPNSQSYRLEVSGDDDFDAHIRDPKQGLLPVRALAIGKRPKRAAQLVPIAADRPPVRMRPYFDGFDWSGWMYAKHLVDESRGSVLLGDFIFGFDKP